MNDRRREGLTCRCSESPRRADDAAWRAEFAALGELQTEIADCYRDQAHAVAAARDAMPASAERDVASIRHGLLMSHVLLLRERQHRAHQVAEACCRQSAAAMIDEGRLEAFKVSPLAAQMVDEAVATFGGAS